MIINILLIIGIFLCFLFHMAALGGITVQYVPVHMYVYSPLRWEFMKKRNHASDKEKHIKKDHLFLSLQGFVLFFSLYCIFLDSLHGLVLWIPAILSFINKYSNASWNIPFLSQENWWWRKHKKWKERKKITLRFFSLVGFRFFFSYFIACLAMWIPVSILSINI